MKQMFVRGQKLPWRLCGDLLVLALLLFWILPVGALQSFGTIVRINQGSEALLLSREGHILQSLRLDSNHRALEWTVLDEISPELIQAVIEVEDQRFYHHDGIDFISIFGSFGRAMRQGLRGASTLSMQCASLLDTTLGQGGHRSWWQKISQAKFAWQLENRWNKKQILEAYLNLSSWRGEIRGIHAASEALFRKKPIGLDLGESYFLASLLRQPDAGIAAVESRACKLLLRNHPDQNCQMITQARTELKTLRLRQMGGLAPHLARSLLQKPGQQLQTSISQPLQAFATEALNRRLHELIGQRVEDAAVLVIDNPTGQVLAYVASSGTLSKSQFVDGIQAKRQAGSTLKPFLFELGIEQGMTAASLLDDSPLNLTTEAGIFTPQNYDKQFQGWVSARRALASSMNIPTLRVHERVGQEAFFQRLQQLGFELEQDADFYGPSLALGSAEVSLWNLTQAYSCLARQGICQDAHFDPQKKSDEHRILSPQASAIIANILSDRSARAWGFGLDNVLNTPFWSAAKTGTSKGMRDNWCIGFTPKYTVGVWVGNFSGQEMGNVSGVSGAAPLWLDLMKKLHQNKPATEPALPSGVTITKVHFTAGHEEDREELFISGTEKTLVLPPQLHKKELLLYPTAGAIIAIDPEIPPASQKMILRRQGGNDLHIYLDGKDLGTQNQIPWFPLPGRHLIQVVNSKLHVLDSAHITVRPLQWIPKVQR